MGRRGERNGELKREEKEEREECRDRKMNLVIEWSRRMIR